MKKETYDFSGWATKNNIRCSDGRTIIKDAFKNQDGVTVPLVWNHDHKDADNVLGHALLENRDQGVYAYCSFNNNERAQRAKELVMHGDIRSLSIYANQLKQNGDSVVHGIIREVSLVLAGANSGAFIETVIAHSDDHDEEAKIFHPYCGEDIVLIHSDENDIDNADESQNEDKLKENKEDESTKKEESVEHADENKEETVEEILKTLTPKQYDAVCYAIGGYLESKGIKDVEHSNENKNSMEDKEEMKHNAFETENNENKNENALTHAEALEILKESRTNGKSVKETFLAHGITDVGNLFPDYKNLNNVPDTIDNPNEYVGKVMAGVKHSPFSRVKTIHMDITADTARAKGFVKGNQKVQEVVATLKRTTDPQTVYKLQKLDRDDVLDITDFDVIAWMKAEMRGKLDEEIARAILIGDGRAADDDDKISPSHIRPVLGDSNIFTVAKILERANDDTDYTFAKKFIRAVIKSRKDYKGSGNPTFFTTEDYLTDMLLIEDTNGRIIYESEAQLAKTLRCKEIVTVQPMEETVRTDDNEEYDYKCMGLYVNLKDYNVGADKGGNVAMFDNFDLNYNKYEYLIETRCSGALVKYHSAVTFEEKVAHVTE